MTDAKILIVEDEPLLAQAMRLYLERAGYGALLVTDTGEDAVRLAREQSPNLILMDIRLAGAIDGIESAAAIHAFAEIPVIYLSAYADDATLERAGTTVPYGYLIKPVDEKELLIAVSVALHKADIDMRLQESEERYRLVVSSLNEGVALQDAAGRILEWNARAQEICGISAQDVIGSTSLDFPCSTIREDGSAFPGNEHPSMITLRTGTPLRNVVMGVQRADGRTVWISVNTQPMGLPGRADPQAVVISFDDITERIHSDRVLREREQRFRSYFEMPLVGVAITSLEKGWIEVNDRICEMLGYSHEALLKKTWTEMTYPDDLAADVQQFDRMLAGEIERYYMEKRFVRSDGGILTVNLSVGCVRRTDRSVDYVVAVLEDITSRKQVELEREQANREWRIIFDAIGHPAIILDSDLRIIFANQATLSAARMTEQEICGRKCCEIFHGVPEPLENCPCMELIKTGNSKGVEREVEVFGGFYVVSCTPVFDEHGRLEKVVHIATDISGRRNMEKCMSESEAKYRGIFNAAQDTLLIFSLDGFIVDANPAACRLYDYTLYELRCLSGRDIVHSDCHRLFEKFNDDLRQKGHFFSESVDVRRDGSAFPVEVSGSIIQYEGSDHLLAVVRNITGRKQSEEEKNRLILAIEQAREAICIFTVDGTLQYANPATEVITGAPLDDVVGKQGLMLDNQRCPDQKALRDQVFEHLRSGSPWSGRITMCSKEGKPCELEMATTPVKDASGTVVSCVLIARDVTKEHQLEMQLRQSQKMEAIGQLASGIAHDFNNILSPIILQTELVTENMPDTNPDRELLRKVVQAANRAADLVKQILTFSWQLEQEFRPVALGTVVDEALRLLRPSIPATIDIVQRMQDGGCLVLADPSQIHRVIINLCTNAVYVMHAAGGTLSIALDAVDLNPAETPGCSDMPAGAYMRLTIEDTGCGMSEAQQPSIFDPFFTTKPVGEGTGLGLSVVYGIVKSHKGTIAVQSAPGRGSTFSIYLPRHAGEQTSARAGQSAPAGGGGERVLLVDDESFLAEALSKKLERLGYRVVMLSDPREALRIFTDAPHDFDLVLTDLTMKGLTGIELSRSIKDLRPDIPIILCSGYSAHLDPVIYEAAGISRYLAKPVSMSVLATALRELLDRQG